jgi:hypothetical protein
MFADQWNMPRTRAQSMPMPVGATEVADRRCHARTERVALVVLVSDGMSDNHPGGEIVLTDTSATGVGFRAVFALPVGARYRLRVDDGPLDQARMVRIVSCRPNDGDFAIGAKYC